MSSERDKERALEAYLVASARTGDRRSMEALVRLRGPRLLSHAARLLGEHEAARDIVQEAWVEILRGISGLRSDHAFLPWALMIVTRRVQRTIRGRQSDRKLALGVAAEPAGETPDAGPDAADAARLRQALTQLSPEHSAVLALFYLQDLSVAEIARALDVPDGTVKTRLMRARDSLRAALKGDHDDQQTG
jgi:RNA polymerase sigma factor (sigma-70 family)